MFCKHFSKNMSMADPWAAQPIVNQGPGQLPAALSAPFAFMFFSLFPCFFLVAAAAHMKLKLTC